MPNVGRPAKPAKKLAQGREPGTRRFAISLPEETIAKIDALAKRNHRSRTAEVEYILDVVANGMPPERV